MRKHLTDPEIRQLPEATKDQRHEARDYALMLLMYRHGLRVSAACAMLLDQVNLASHQLQVVRLKNGLSTTHPLRADELKALKRWLAVRPDCDDPHLFIGEGGGPLLRRSVHHLVRRYGEIAAIGVPVHPDTLRHACGFVLADQGADAFLVRDYLGHRNIANSSIYGATSQARVSRIRW